MRLPEVALKEDVIWRVSAGFARDIGQRLNILMPLTLYSLKQHKGSMMHHSITIITTQSGCKDLKKMYLKFLSKNLKF